MNSTLTAPASAPFGSRTDADRDNFDTNGEPLTPEQRRIKEECQPLALAALWELEDAMQGVLDAQEDDADADDGIFIEDVTGISHFTFYAAQLIEGDTPFAVGKQVESARELRRQAFARGDVDYGDPVLRGARALDAAEETLRAILDRFPKDSDTCLEHDCRHHLWLLHVARGGYDNSSGCRMIPADRQAHLADLLGQDPALFAPGGQLAGMTVAEIAAMV